MKRTALIIIDVQNDFVTPSSRHHLVGAEELISKIAQLLGWYRGKGGQVIYVIRHYRASGVDIEKFRRGGFLEGNTFLVPDTIGAEIPTQIKPLDGEIVLVKNRFSAFMFTELDLILRRMAVSRLFVCGIQYPNCIRATVYDAVALDYDVTLITDCTWGASEDVSQANIRDMKNIGVECLRAGDLIKSYS